MSILGALFTSSSSEGKTKEKGRSLVGNGLRNLFAAGDDGKALLLGRIAFSTFERMDTVHFLLVLSALTEPNGAFRMTGIRTDSV